MGGVGVSTLLNKLMILLDPSIWVDQKYILETFSNLSKNGVMVSFLSTPKLKDVLLPFLTCDVEPLRSTTKIIFDKLRLQNVSMMASSMAPPLFDEECLPSFLCPITQEIMVNPVLLLETGMTYEHEAIKTWFETKNTDPISGVQVKNKSLVPILSLKNAIEEWKEQQRKKQKVTNGLYPS
eukprot:TRINITY_DN11864_c0_g1_i16.p1 TRINITY_DN11864_c0_g1~~TRINITY_DN11864_c0_g1_i16.p1  ORF type:complete len:181 (+),score=48.65 TRINITY_DN11864_c0_g1_i16:858-1400(+)